ncbi:MAG TPA: zf-HC2 domain-containing protein [Capsulimonadaceae bacterium]|jgi:anti-sigma factor (TIGR02949 family)
MPNDDEKPAMPVEVKAAVVSFDFYSCEEAVKRLNDYLDHELDPAERDDVVKHLKLCKPCLERFSFEQSLIVSLKTKVQKFCAPTELKSRLSTLIHRR